MAQALADVENHRVRLLGEVAHEMRTPIAILTGEVEGMLDGVLPTDPERLASVGDELHRLKRLADDLAELSRAEAGQMSLDPADIDLRSLVARVIGRFESVAQQTGVRLTLAPGGPVHAVADPDRLAQVVRNLVSNALRATPAGGEVTVTITDADPVRITVTDTGVGLGEHELERVFERFYRARPREVSDGSGIGLTIARQLMQAHGGDLEASSPGRGLGATFVAWLPRHRPHDAR